ncbi:MAG: hypothetical protein DRP13_03040, partial [Candidatus Aenigmatarchaeota archaeon]
PLDQTFLEKVWLTLSFQMEAVSSFLLKLFFEKMLEAVSSFLLQLFLEKSWVNAFFLKKKGLYGIVFSFR